MAYHTLAHYTLAHYTLAHHMAKFSSSHHQQAGECNKKKRIQTESTDTSLVRETARVDKTASSESKSKIVPYLPSAHWGVSASCPSAPNPTADFLISAPCRPALSGTRWHHRNRNHLLIYPLHEGKSLSRRDTLVRKRLNIGSSRRRRCRDSESQDKKRDTEKQDQCCAKTSSSDTILKFTPRTHRRFAKIVPKHNIHAGTLSDRSTRRLGSETARARETQRRNEESESRRQVQGPRSGNEEYQCKTKFGKQRHLHRTTCPSTARGTKEPHTAKRSQPRPPRTSLKKTAAPATSKASLIQDNENKNECEHQNEIFFLKSQVSTQSLLLTHLHSLETANWVRHNTKTPTQPLGNQVAMQQQETDFHGEGRRPTDDHLDRRRECGSPAPHGWAKPRFSHELQCNDQQKQNDKVLEQEISPNRKKKIPSLSQAHVRGRDASTVGTTQGINTCPGNNQSFERQIPLFSLLDRTISAAGRHEALGAFDPCIETRRHSADRRKMPSDGRRRSLK
ncbi:uncharacterized protein FMAN_09494 [Fusarium mangiferae]|uniref:Uncharacterized protein n=1 Tax=Fusarium mangiferae TaxID=192010 RepID=A0A1L7T5E2_FUSMA|nr:uncharacterized protein FMAN_09494 [Fusarium mangiferae]CVK91353.1 uncharacterized protein FMAN_09494 [Fusarium mangiferae]